MYERLAAEVPEVGAAIGLWEAAPDLERWLSVFYQYFELKGYRGVLSKHVLHLAALGFSAVLCFFLLFFVDWGALASCDSEESCHLVSLCYEEPFQNIGLWRFMVMASFAVFAVYWIFNAVGSYHTFHEAKEMSLYYKERLGITSDEVLGTMQWSEVVSRLVQQQRRSPICMLQDELTALEIANVILREENYIVALTNHRAFTSCLPPWLPTRLVYTRAVLGCLRTAIFRWALDHRGRVKQDFLDSPENLARRLRWIGIFYVALAMPVSIFVTLVFFMRHAEEFRSQKASPLRREWTDFAKWTFREFNEYPHQFKERMQTAHTAAEEFVALTDTSSPIMDALRRFLKFVSGSMLAVLFAVAIYDDTPMLFVVVYGKNLLWYFAVFGFLFAVADNSQEQHVSAVNASRFAGVPLLMHVSMMRLARCTHHLPPSWRPPAPLAALAGGCGGTQRARLGSHFAGIRAEFLRDFFVVRIQDLAEELLGVLLAPLLLGVYLPKAAPHIVEVFRCCTYTSRNLGDWCAFGCLDPWKNGNEFYGGPPRSSLSSPTSVRGGSHFQAGPDHLWISRGGKLEKSVLSFILAHRLAWSGSDANGSSSSSGPRRRENIQMENLGGGPHEEQPDEVVERHSPAEVVGSGDVCETWGYPMAALNLLFDVEEFQRREAGEGSPQQRLYALFPEDLIELERVVPSKGDIPAAPAMALPVRGRGAMESYAEQEHGSCSSHFFWLEILYDFHSGVHASHLGDVGGGACFEMLETGS